MLAGKVDGVSPSEDVARNTLSRIVTLAKQRPLVYLPSHDHSSAERLVNRAVIVADGD